MKDDRLYARFTLDFPDHPKIKILSDSAFRTLVSAAIYSRRMETDGFLARRLALAMWPLEALQELCSNDSIKPSLSETEDGWQIHDYAEQQDTKADIAVRKAAGRRGGLITQAKKRAAKSKPLLEQPLEQPLEPHLNSTSTERERKTEKNSGQVSAHRYVGDARHAQTESADDDAFEQATSERGRNLSPPVTIGASRLVGLAFPIGTINDADRTTLRIKTNEGLAKHHRTEQDMAECLRIWSTKDDLGPNALLCCLTEVDKRKLNGRKLSTSDRNFMAIQALKRDGPIKTPEELFGEMRQLNGS